MKLSKLKAKLEEKQTLVLNKQKRIKQIRREFKKEKGARVLKLELGDLNTSSKLDKVKVIGITGSCGKSTTAYLVHEYLKSLGYKSMLYSSIKVDSPAGYTNPNEAYEVAVYNEEGLLSILEEAEAYEADYLVLEINESAIVKGLVKDIPFTIRALTNLNPKHDEEQYREDEYVAIKKSFFENIENEEDCKCVIGFQNYSKELFEELLLLNGCEKKTFSSNYVATKNKLDTSKITCLLKGLDTSLSGMNMKVLLNDSLYNIKTNVMMPYNALNFLCAMTILEALGEFNEEKFNFVVKDIQIPGRENVYITNGRMVVIDAHLPKMLESLKQFKDKGLINRIKVVIGSSGSGFKYWNKRFVTPKSLENRHKTRAYAMDLLKNYVDYVYLTENDNAAESVLSICQELKKYLNEAIPSIIVEDREAAISKAIMESEVGDVIFISGRGNRRILCNTATTMKLIKDSEVVEKVLKKLGW